jgi:hypothetical protein
MKNFQRLVIIELDPVKDWPNIPERTIIETALSFPVSTTVGNYDKKISAHRNFLMFMPENVSTESLFRGVKQYHQKRTQVAIIKSGNDKLFHVKNLVGAGLDVASTVVLVKTSENIFFLYFALGTEVKGKKTKRKEKIETFRK